MSISQCIRTGQFLWRAQRRGAYRVVEEEPEGQRPFRRPRRRWKGNIKMNIKEIS
jgi:hypothetical protein